VNWKGWLEAGIIVGNMVTVQKPVDVLPPLICPPFMPTVTLQSLQPLAEAQGGGIAAVVVQEGEEGVGVAQGPRPMELLTQVQ
jgi:hypothetical protein